MYSIDEIEESFTDFMVGVIFAMPHFVYWKHGEINVAIFTFNSTFLNPVTTYPRNYHVPCNSYQTVHS